MPCYDNYIGLDNLIPSRSGLYVDSLPGIDIVMIDGLRKNAKDSTETWDVIYLRAWNNFIGALTLALQDKFYVDSKLVSRETSQFKSDVNLSADLAGVTIEFKLPRYAKLHIVSIDVFSDQPYASPEVIIRVYDTDENGDVLSEFYQEFTEGRNTIFIDQDYEVDKVFVAFDPGTYAFRETENKKYQTPYLFYSCDECTFDCGGYQGVIKQINGGGLNVKYNVLCSVEKFACENINLFTQVFLYRLGMEITAERRFGERLNRFTTMTLERAEELMMYYTDNFEKNLERSVRSQNMHEDPYCFSCKELVSSKSQTP